MNSIEQCIIEYANVNKTFRTNALFESLSCDFNITKKGLSWYLSKLVAIHHLFRAGRGIYTIESKQAFYLKPDAKAIRVYKQLTKQFPLLSFCVYNGEMLAPLQHHLSYNNNIYVETERDAIEAVFHALQGNNKSVYLSPSEEMISDYIHLDGKSIIVKPLISESPLQKSQGVNIPTIEKLLVDIQCDADFFYLQGSEIDYILDNAFSLYNVNPNLLLRYASRRNLKTRIEEYLKK